MEDDHGQESYKLDEDEDETCSIPDDGKLETTLIMAEELPDHHTSGREEGRISVFKTELPSELGGMEMEQFSSADEAEMNTIMKTEVVDQDGDNLEEVDTDELQQVTGQQFIILSRTTNENSDGSELSETVQTKYIRIDGADGQTYVLALTDDRIISPPPSSQKSSANSPAGTTKERSIKDPAEVIFEMSKDERKNFYRTIALGIERPLFSVYRRVTRMYDQKNHRGKYTPSEMKNLKVFTKHGNDWAAIGVALGRSASSVKDKCRLMKDNCNSGKWYPEEEERLAAAVYKLTGLKPSNSDGSGGFSLSYCPPDEEGFQAFEVLQQWTPQIITQGATASDGSPGILSGAGGPIIVQAIGLVKHVNLSSDTLSAAESITSGLSWASVAQHVGTRSEKQCRTKWLNYLNWKQQGGADWTRDDDTLLIDKVSKMNVTSDTEIDWVALSQDWASVRSPQWLRGKWWALKRHIADYNKLSYPALLEQMHQVIHWNLKPKLGSRHSKDSVAGSSSDIFKECIPVSLTANSDGSGGFSLSYCPPDEEGFQAFEVLQQWTPQIITQGATASDGSSGILSGAGGPIIVQAIGAPLNDNIHLNGQQQVIISAADVAPEDLTSDDGTIHGTDGQDLSGDNLHDSSITSFNSGSEEIITVSEFNSQSESGDQDLMNHDVFETVTSESSSDLVMGVTSSHHASSLMTSLKDPILMSSSDVECEKSQSAVLTDESSEMID
ncbi:Cyclin-D-binding Myb-like transcription factor 1 [Bulinus truncatus]|nr:Cyclin-D-binding Myb-like transcription factor 1 [Bulinus truncatus]